MRGLDPRSMLTGRKSESAAWVAGSSPATTAGGVWFMSIGHAFKRARNACSAVAIGALVSSGGGASDLRIMEAKRTGRIIVGLAGEAVGVRRRFGCHANLRGNAGFVRNAVPAALQADALIPAASPGAAARLVSTVRQNAYMSQYFLRRSRRRHHAAPAILAATASPCSCSWRCFSFSRRVAPEVGQKESQVP